MCVPCSRVQAKCFEARKMHIKIARLNLKPPVTSMFDSIKAFSLAIKIIYPTCTARSLLVSSAVNSHRVEIIKRSLRIIRDTFYTMLALFGMGLKCLCALYMCFMCRDQAQVPSSRVSLGSCTHCISFEYHLAPHDRNSPQLRELFNAKRRNLILQTRIYLLFK